MNLSICRALPVPVPVGSGVHTAHGVGFWVRTWILSPVTSTVKPSFFGDNFTAACSLVFFVSSMFAVACKHGQPRLSLWHSIRTERYVRVVFMLLPPLATLAVNLAISYTLRSIFVHAWLARSMLSGTVFVNVRYQGACPGQHLAR